MYFLRTCLSPPDATLVLFFFHSDPGKIIFSSRCCESGWVTDILKCVFFFTKSGGKKRPACWLLDMWNVLLFWYLKLREHNKGVSWHSFCVFHCWDEWSAVFGENMTLAWWVKWAIISWDDTKQAGWGVFLKYSWGLLWLRASRSFALYYIWEYMLCFLEMSASVITMLATKKRMWRERRAWLKLYAHWLLTCDGQVFTQWVSGFVTQEKLEWKPWCDQDFKRKREIIFSFSVFCSV